MDPITVHTGAAVPIPPPTKILQLRTGKMAAFGQLSSGIAKNTRTGSLAVSKTGLQGDEHDPTFHGGIDKAVHQYCAEHYAAWQALYPDPEIAARFQPGGFGENLVTTGWTEDNICAGDVVRVGYADERRPQGCTLQVSLPRQPCFKLNQRFGIKAFAPQTHARNKTGWYYRVLAEGCIEAGMQMRVVERPHPAWPIARLHQHVHRDRDNAAAIDALRHMPALGDECRDVFEQRWQKMQAQATRAAQPWRRLRVQAVASETARVKVVTLEAVDPAPAADEHIPPSSHVVLKLPNGLQRAYSVVGGAPAAFTLGVARDAASRGASAYIHDHLQPGAVLDAGPITAGMAFNCNASHHVLVAGGIGITAFTVLMHRAWATNQSFELHYCVRSPADVAFASLLAPYGSRVTVYDSSKGERLDIHDMMRRRVWNSCVYVCGPQRMLDAAAAARDALGMPEDELRFETFKTAAGGDPFSVSVDRGGSEAPTVVDVTADQSLLEALRSVGLDVPSSCETGNCGTCKVRVKCGKVLHGGSALSKEDKETEMLSCVSRGVGHIEIAMLD